MPALPRPPAQSPAKPEPEENNDERDPVSIVPLPRRPDRRNAAPAWRWARPGATMTLIAGAMLASAVATTAWHFGRADGQPRDDATPQVLAAPSAPLLPYHGSAGNRASRRPAVAKSGVQPQPAVPGDAVAVRPTTARIPTRNPAPAASRAPRPEAKPYGPWQCTQSIALEWSSKIALATKPCQMLGRDIQYQASLTAPGGATGSITVSLQEAGSGRTVAGPKTCDGLAFGGDAATRSCGPSGASPGARAHVRGGDVLPLRARRADAGR